MIIGSRLRQSTSFNSIKDFADRTAASTFPLLTFSECFILTVTVKTALEPYPCPLIFFLHFDRL